MTACRAVSTVSGLLALGALAALAGSSLTLLASLWLGVAICALLLSGRLGPAPVVAYLAVCSTALVVTTPGTSYGAITLAMPLVAAAVALLGSALSLDGGRTARLWALGMLLMGTLVASFSGPAGGAGRMFVFLTEWLGVAPGPAETIVFYARKTMHVGFYALLAAVASGFARIVGPSRATLFALCWAFVHALFDETRQAASVGRTGTAGDIALDLAGATLGLLLTALLRRSSRREPS